MHVANTWRVPSLRLQIIVPRSLHHCLSPDLIPALPPIKDFSTLVYKFQLGENCKLQFQLVECSFRRKHYNIWCHYCATVNSSTNITNHDLPHYSHMVWGPKISSIHLNFVASIWGPFKSHKIVKNLLDFFLLSWQSICSFIAMEWNLIMDFVSFTCWIQGITASKKLCCRSICIRLRISCRAVAGFSWWRTGPVRLIIRISKSSSPLPRISL